MARLLINGTSTNQVYFTSINDDSVGGQTNNNANPPAAGNWGRVYFRGGSAGSLGYVEMRYGGYSGGGGAMLYTDGGTTVSVDHGVFKNSQECAISSDPGYDPTLTNMSHTDFTGSNYNGICMRNLGISVNSTWDETEASYVLLDDVTVTSGYTLTLGPGVVVKPAGYYVDLLVDGTLLINGTSTNQVYFTSINDDSVGGQTNNNANPPAAGNWGRVYFRGGSAGSLGYVEMRYGGYSGGGGAMLYTDGGTTVSVDHGVFKNSQECAISSDPGYDPTLTNMSHTDFTGSNYNGICMRNLGISVNSTWDETEASYVLLDDVTVTSGYTLTLGPGVVVKPAGYYVDLLVDGTLLINGTSTNQVYFTSINDDSVGGQTNNNANPPAAGNWGRVYFRGGSGGTLEYVEMRYGGYYAGGGAMLYTDGGTTVSVDHGVFKNSQECAISSDPGYDPTLTNMSHTDFTGSNYNGICMRNLGISVNSTWDETEASYVLLDDVTVTSGYTLTLGPGVVVKPAGYYVDLLVDGTLLINGTSTNQVYFTSINDDSVGGQTNNNANPPAAGNWGRVYFRGGSGGTLGYVEMRFGEDTIYVQDASPVIANCVLRNNARGLSSYGQNAHPKINYCGIYSNSEYGVYNGQSGQWLDAKNNWWGSTTGPYDPSPPGADGQYNYGSGDKVNDYVLYNPWTTTYNVMIFLPLTLR